ncbi:polyprenyl synthetase family protein [Streptomyces sp. I05A-00742]|uniref:polyprenyl synthetase family protein n=1 Tax=Streptomyces sp. I05A-00742 TaxID=2732853 RepID=UPI0014885E37|nr:polyprenyl synthetase family protein [Streptomyces sp. I05A-00742]
MTDDMPQLSVPRAPAAATGGPARLPLPLPPTRNARPVGREVPGPGITPRAQGDARVARTASALHEGITRLCPAAPGAVLSAELMGREGLPALDPAGSADRDRRLHAALVAPVRHLLDAGGKRWRGHLMARILELFGAGGHHYAELVAACEVGHAGSLMVDDVEDASSLRRGSPAAHTVFGEATAINAGTAAYFSLDRAIRHTLPEDAELRLAVYETYLAGLRATHAGQALDIQGHQEELELALTTSDSRPLLRMLALTHRLKTGVQVRVVCEIGALAGRATPEQRTALGEFGEALGLAYQITDDIGDLRGVTHRDRATKHAAEDLRNTKVTFPLAYAVALLPRAEATALWRSLRAGPDERAVARAVRTIEDCGAVAACEKEAARLLDDAWAAVRPCLPDSPHTAALADMAAAVVRRTWTT